MKKVFSLKEVLIVLICIIMVAFSTTVFATDGLIYGGNTPTEIGADEYQDVQPGTGNGSNTNTNTNTNTNKTKIYNTNNSSNLPQTGIEDYNIGILLIICVASALYAYKKISYYKNI